MFGGMPGYSGNVNAWDFLKRAYRKKGTAHAFDVAMGGGQLGMGASIALAMLPPLALIIDAMSLYMKPNKQ